MAEISYPNGLHFAGTNEGAFRSSDGGVYWNAINTGLGDTVIYTFAISDTDLFAGTDFGIAHSNDWGLNWLHNPLICHVYHQQAHEIHRKGDSLIAGGLYFGLSFSIDDGVTWECMLPGSIRSFAVDDQIMYYSDESMADGQVFVWQGNGAYWTLDHYDLPTTAAPTSILVDKHIVYMSTTDVGVIRSVDSAHTWSLANEGLSNMSVTAMRIWNDSLFIGTNDGRLWCRPTEEVLPVTLRSFSAATFFGSVHLKWTTVTETNCYGFEIERRRTSPSGSWQSIGFVSGSGTTVVSHDYSFLDCDVQSGRLEYRLRQIDSDGSYHYYESTILEIPPPPETVLLLSYPNPANPSSTITLELSTTVHATSLTVYDLWGRSVAELWRGPLTAGTYTFHFDASDISSGVYFCVLHIGSHCETKRILVVR